MIKIISRGNLKRYIRTCSNCGCVFEYEESDLDVDAGCDSFGQYKREYITCPECHDRAIVYLCSDTWIKTIFEDDYKELAPDD